MIICCLNRSQLIVPKENWYHLLSVHDERRLRYKRWQLAGWRLKAYMNMRTLLYLRKQYNPNYGND